MQNIGIYAGRIHNILLLKDILSLTRITKEPSFFLSFLRKQESTDRGSATSAKNGFLLSQE
ncbi:Uncharacterized protein dnm_088820 [Desulfonema magnum]|uniref:Uncharacterized protein n=1 Tax=Desulfonema magnum TaxID=45655 RepID=A0A975BW05_9BACT|nr:Uncharacterized protein dnm_088820 [Desulfonema magnum]